MHSAVRNAPDSDWEATLTEIAVDRGGDGTGTVAWQSIRSGTDRLVLGTGRPRPL